MRTPIFYREWLAKYSPPLGTLGSYEIDDYDMTAKPIKSIKQYFLNELKRQIDPRHPTLDFMVKLEIEGRQLRDAVMFDKELNKKPYDEIMKQFCDEIEKEMSLELGCKVFGDGWINYKNTPNGNVDYSEVRFIVNMGVDREK